jgi:hypothetical protein
MVTSTAACAGAARTLAASATNKTLRDMRSVPECDACNLDTLYGDIRCIAEWLSVPHG